MIKVTFHPIGEVCDSLLKFAVIAAKYHGKWVFVRHKQRATWEIPGGHREPGERIEATACRELWEETGAAEADIRPVCVYGVTRDGVTTYGMLFLAEIRVMEPLSPNVEIGETALFDHLPDALTYPDIQPHLHRYVSEHFSRN